MYFELWGNWVYWFPFQRNWVSWFLFITPPSPSMCSSWESSGGPDALPLEHSTQTHTGAESGTSSIPRQPVFWLLFLSRPLKPLALFFHGIRYLCGPLLQKFEGYFKELFRWAQEIGRKTTWDEMHEKVAQLLYLLSLRGGQKAFGSWDLPSILWRVGCGRGATHFTFHQGRKWNFLPEVLELVLIETTWWKA